MPWCRACPAGQKDPSCYPGVHAVCVVAAAPGQLGQADQLGTPRPRHRRIGGHLLRQRRDAGDFPWPSCCAIWLRTLLTHPERPGTVMGAGKEEAAAALEQRNPGDVAPHFFAWPHRTKTISGPCVSLDGPRPPPHFPEQRSPMTASHLPLGSLLIAMAIRLHRLLQVASAALC